MMASMTGSAFFYASASQFDELYVGRGALRIRNLFENARNYTRYTFWENINASIRGVQLPEKKAVIFVDELDAIGSRKNTFGNHSSQHATVSQLLTCLDGLEDRGSIFVIAATNNLELIDEALRRSGRFDRVIEIPLPDYQSRLELLWFYLNDKPGFDELNNLELIDEALRRSGRFDRVIEIPLPDYQSRLELLWFYLNDKPGFDELNNLAIFDEFAAKMDMFSAADIKNFCSECVMIAIRSNIQNSGTIDTFNSEECILTEDHLNIAYEELSLKIKKNEKSTPQFFVH
eukprot:TRINITY_DN4062_c0_g1_i2.p1 TRINITY_DN4062_c0_g1~~TRINITY_DN4062_c0_g1_i2.p1  ORF type:complete len:289 (-),score=61.13 TRINITY_DN4062_c0_g1_i2:370-1236(-)